MAQLFKVATISKVTKSPHSWMKKHWAIYKKIRDQWHKDLLVVFGPCPEELRGKKRKVTITQYRTQLLDEPDNINNSCKPIYDVLQEYISRKVSKKDQWLLDTGVPRKDLLPQGLGWLVDDSLKWSVKPPVTQIKVRHRKDQKIIITIEDYDES